MKASISIPIFSFTETGDGTADVVEVLKLSKCFLSVFIKFNN